MVTFPSGKALHPLFSLDDALPWPGCCTVLSKTLHHAACSQALVHDTPHKGVCVVNQKDQDQQLIGRWVVAVRIVWLAIANGQRDGKHLRLGLGEQLLRGC